LIFPSHLLTGDAFPMAELPHLSGDEAPAAKLLRTAGGEKGEGGVPPIVKDAGREMAATKKVKKEEKKKVGGWISQHATLLRLSAFHLHWSSRSQTDGAHRAPHCFLPPCFSISIGARGHDCDGSGFDSAAWVLNPAMPSLIRPPRILMRPCRLGKHDGRRR